MEIAESRSIDDIVANGYEVRGWEYVKKGLAIFREKALAFTVVALGCTVLDGILEWVFPLLTLIGVTFLSLTTYFISQMTWKILRSETASIESTLVDPSVLKRLIASNVFIQVIFIGFQVLPDLANLSYAQVLVSETPINIINLTVAFQLFSVAGYGFIVVIFTFSSPLIIERKFGVFESILLSFKVVRKKFWEITYFLFITMLPLWVPFFVLVILAFFLSEMWWSEIFQPIVVGEIHFLIELGPPIAQFGEGLDTNMGAWSIMMLGVGLLWVLLSCIVAVAYADIFGLRQIIQKESSSLSTPTA